MRGKKVWGALSVFFGGASFGVLSTIVKKAYEQSYSLGEVTGIQALLGAIVLWIIVCLTGLFSPKQSNSSGRNSWLKVIVVGTSSGAVSLAYYQCVKLLPASVAIILLMQYLWISILLEFLLFRKRPNRVQTISVILVMVGTLFASGLFSNELQSLNWKGAGYGLLAAAAYAVFLFVNGRIGNGMSAMRKSALMVTGACILIFCLFPPTFIINGTLCSGLFVWGLPLALFGTIIPPLFFAYGMSKVGVTTGAILSSTELPVAVIMSYFVLHEHVSLLQCFGVTVIFASIILPRVLHK